MDLARNSHHFGDAGDFASLDALQRPESLETLGDVNFDDTVLKDGKGGKLCASTGPKSGGNGEEARINVPV